MRHNNVNLWSVFVNEESGEWKLGSVEYMTTVDAAYTSLPPVLQVYKPPEAKDNSKPVSKWYFCYIHLTDLFFLKLDNVYQFVFNSGIDMWGLGCLIWEAFNGPLTASGNLDAMDQVIQFY